MNCFFRDQHEALYNATKPYQYVGGEFLSRNKDFDSAKVRFAFVFPDKYEIGISNLGVRIIYDRVNSVERFLADRAYAPEPDFKPEFLYGVESKRALKDFDGIGFSLQYELSYPTDKDSTNYSDPSFANLGYYYTKQATVHSASYGDVYTIANPTAYTLNDGTVLTAPMGTTFAGWCLRNSLVTDAAVIVSKTNNANTNLTWSYDTDIYFYACYTLNTYTVEYKYSGGQAGVSTNTTYEHYKTNLEYSETLYVPNPTRVGYNFRGWILEYTSEDEDLHQSGITSALIPFL